MQDGIEQLFTSYLDLKGERERDDKEALQDCVVSICSCKLTLSRIKFISLDIRFTMLIKHCKASYFYLQKSQV